MVKVRDKSLGKRPRIEKAILILKESRQDKHKEPTNSQDDRDPEGADPQKPKLSIENPKESNDGSVDEVNPENR